MAVIDPGHAPDETPDGTGDETGGVVVVRYWAAARAAAGVESDTVAVDGPTTLSELVAELRDRHRDRDRFADVVGVCSVLVGDRPVAGRDPGSVLVGPGESVELLPPFAGG